MPLLTRTRVVGTAFIVAFVISGLSITHRRQLGSYGGLTDEWYALGVNLAVHGTFGLGERPVVNRAPGYPLFIATTLRVLAGAPDRSKLESYSTRGVAAVYLAQAVLLACSAALVTLWALRWVGAPLALLVGLAFGTSPYTVVLVGLLHYDLLHIFLLLVSTLAVEAALRAHRYRWLALGGAGALWGLTTLVRPLTLLLPPFLLVALWLHPRSGRRRAPLDVVALTLGMALVIAPYTIRNYRVSQRFIPVNAQAWEAVWGSTVERLGFDPNHYYWGDLYQAHFMPLFSRVTGSASYDLGIYHDYQSAIQDGFRSEVLENLRRRPEVYAYNVVRSAALLSLKLNVVVLDAFRDHQSAHTLARSGIWVSGPQRLYRPSVAAHALSLLYALVTLCAVFGAILAVVRREAGLLVPAAAWLCLWVSHSVSYVDTMYLYVRVPFLFLFAAYGLSGVRRSCGLAVAAVLALGSLGLTLFSVLLFC
jgi:hypothetical protein